METLFTRQTLYTVAAGLVIAYVFYRFGSRVAMGLVQNYTRRLVLRRHCAKLEKTLRQCMLAQHQNQQGILEAFEHFEVMAIVTDMLADCESLGIPCREIALLLNDQYPHPNAHWEAIPSGLALRTNYGRVYFSQDCSR